MGAATQHTTVVETQQARPDQELTVQASISDIRPITLSALCPGQSAGRYVILQLVGTGGFGDVYAAYDPHLDRRVALKLMKAKTNRLGSAREQLQREAQTLARLTHENVLRVYDFGEIGEQVFVTMEFVDGHTLKPWFDAGQSWEDVRDTMLAAGRGLAAAHNAGIVHADFKPHNVLVDAHGRVMVADFGLAQALGDPNEFRGAADQFMRSGARAGAALPSATPTASPSGSDDSTGRRQRRPVIAGSPAYMAPELFRGEPVTELSDQYSFCIALFEGLYGRRPYTQNRIAELREAVLAGAIEHPTDERGVPKYLRDICLRGISTVPEDRFTSMDELLAALAHDGRHRARGWLAIALTACLSSLLAFAIAVGMREQPTVAELGQIDALVVQARGAAAKNFFVHPPVEDPQAATAYSRVMVLEKLEGKLRDRGQEVALNLRHEFAETLRRIGDYYWETELGKPFARDYYLQSLLFESDHEEAKSRSRAMAGEVADLRSKAETMKFSRYELVAAEPLAALAETEPKVRADALAQIKRHARERSSTLGERLDWVERASVAVSANAAAATKIVRPSGTSVANRVFASPLPSPQELESREGPAIGVSEVSSELTIIDDKPATTHDKNTRTRAAKDTATPVDFESDAGNPTAATRLVEEGRKALRDGKLDRATQLFHRALKMHRQSAGALMGLCDAYFERGDYRKAVEYGESGVALASKVARYRVSLGDAYQRALRYPDAIRQYEVAADAGDKIAARRLETLKKRVGDK